MGEGEKLMFGLEHLANCHGEVAALMAMLGMIPFLGPWLKSKIKHSKGCEHPPEDGGDG